MASNFKFQINVPGFSKSFVVYDIHSVSQSDQNEVLTGVFSNINKFLVITLQTDVNKLFIIIEV